MKAKTYLVERQVAWAKRKSIKLRVSPGNQDSVDEWDGKKDRTAYTTKLEDNLFESMDEDVKADFVGGDGGELNGNMQALYSSSAMGCNLFHHLRKPENQSALLDVLGLRMKAAHSIRFEQKRKIMEDPKGHGFPHDPNVDVVMRFVSERQSEIGVECKFIEPWRDKPKGLSQRYLNQVDLWADKKLEHCNQLAERLVVKGKNDPDPIHSKLHAAQLLKHILGLRHENRVGGKSSFELVYLFYDVPGEEGARHLRELTEFAQVAHADGIRFRWITCQEFILRLLKHRNHFPAYVDYLAERYL